MFRRLAPYLVVFSGLGFFACLGGFAYLARISPPHPDPLTGQVMRMNDHGYYFYVYPWQAWLLNMGLVGCLGAIFAVVGIGRSQNWNWSTLVAPRWLRWLYFAGFGVCLLYVFLRVP